MNLQQVAKSGLLDIQHGHLRVPTCCGHALLAARCALLL
jgi:hypothetical protein